MGTAWCDGCEWRWLLRKIEVLNGLEGAWHRCWLRPQRRGCHSNHQPWAHREAAPSLQPALRPWRAQAHRTGASPQLRERHQPSSPCVSACCTPGFNAVGAGATPSVSAPSTDPVWDPLSAQRRLRLPVLEPGRRFHTSDNASKPARGDAALIDLIGSLAAWALDLKPVPNAPSNLICPVLRAIESGTRDRLGRSLERQPTAQWRKPVPRTPTTVPIAQSSGNAPQTRAQPRRVPAASEWVRRRVGEGCRFTPQCRSRRACELQAACRREPLRA